MMPFMDFSEGEAHVAFGDFFATFQNGVFGGVAGDLCDFRAGHAVHFKSELPPGHTLVGVHGGKGYVKDAFDLQRRGERNPEHFVEAADESGIERGIEVGGGDDESIAAVSFQHFEKRVGDAGGLAHVVADGAGASEGVAFVEEESAWCRLGGIEHLAEIRVSLAEIRGKQGVESDLEQRQAGVPCQTLGGETFAAAGRTVEEDTAAGLQAMKRQTRAGGEFLLDPVKSGFHGGRKHHGMAQQVTRHLLQERCGIPLAGGKRGEFARGGGLNCPSRRSFKDSFEIFRHPQVADFLLLLHHFAAQDLHVRTGTGLDRSEKALE